MEDESLRRTDRVAPLYRCDVLSCTATRVQAGHVTPTSTGSLIPCTLITFRPQTLDALSGSHFKHSASRWRLQYGRGGRLIAASHHLALGPSGIAVRWERVMRLHTSSWRMDDKERSVLEKAVDTLKEKKNKKVAMLSKINKNIMLHSGLRGVEKITTVSIPYKYMYTCIYQLAPMHIHTRTYGISDSTRYILPLQAIV